MEVPKHKFDFDALNEFTLEEIREHQVLLLEWLEDINWPISARILEILRPNVNIIEQGLLFVFQSSNDVWIYNVLAFLLNSSDNVTKPVIDAVRGFSTADAEIQRERALFLLKNDTY